MQVSQKDGAVTIIYSQKDIAEVKEVLQEIKKDYYIFSYEPNKCYQLRKRDSPKITKKDRQKYKTGFVGVQYTKSSRNYRANIKVNGKSTHLGTRDTAAEAFQLRLDYIELNGLKGYVNGVKRKQ